MSAHELLIFRAGGIGGWWTECRHCADFEGRVEDNRPDALQHFWAHTRGLSLPPLSGVASVDPSAVERRRKHLWPLVGAVVGVALAVLAAGIEGGAFSW